MIKMTKEEIELLKSGQYRTYYPDTTANHILHDSAEYFKDHPDKKLTITCRWDELYNIWKLSATIIDTGSEKMELNALDHISCAQQTSLSDQKEPSLKQVSDQPLSVTQEPSLTKTDTSSILLQTGENLETNNVPNKIINNNPKSIISDEYDKYIDYSDDYHSYFIGYSKVLNKIDISDDYDPVSIHSQEELDQFITDLRSMRYLLNKEDQNE